LGSPVNRRGWRETATKGAAAKLTAAAGRRPLAANAETCPMAWTKAPQALMDLFVESLPDAPGLTSRKMFGYPAAFVHGNMMAGVFGDGVFARLPADLRAHLERDHAARPFEPMAGKPMKDYLGLPEAIVADEGRLAEVLAAAYRATAALPPKAEKPKPARRKA
jgi:TfoX/Sxy family transcriptional regulator of competence genes